MRIIFTFILIALYSFQVFPQITFERTYGTIDDDQGCAVSVCYDGTYIIAGTVDNIYTGDPDVYLARLDQYGDTIWTRSFVNAYCSDYAYDMLQCYDSGFVITGTTYSNDTSMPFLLKYDKNGQFAWFKKYGQELPDGYAYALVEKPDSGYMICGRRDIYDMRWIYRPFLLETDEYGNCTSFKIYDGFSEYAIYEASHICLSAKNDYVMCGEYEDFFVDNLDQAWLFNVDTNTNVAWSKTYGCPDSTTHIRDVKLTDDGGYILCGSIYQGDVILFGMDFGIYLVKTDNDGNEEWRKTLGYDDRAEYGGCIDIAEDGGFIIGSGSDFGSEYDDDIWLVKTDESGDTSWTQRYGSSNLDVVTDVCATPDGGYILCGYTESYGLGGSDIYVIKTDNNGLLTRIQKNIDELSGVEVIPNPGNGLFRIRNCHDDLNYAIYNLNGQIIKNKALISPDEEVDIRNFSPGIYFLQLRSAKASRSVKIIKNQ